MRPMEKNAISREVWLQFRPFFFKLVKRVKIIIIVIFSNDNFQPLEVENAFKFFSIFFLVILMLPSKHFLAIYIKNRKKTISFNLNRSSVRTMSRKWNVNSGIHFDKRSSCREGDVQRLCSSVVSAVDRQSKDLGSTPGQSKASFFHRKISKFFKYLNSFALFTI